MIHPIDLLKLELEMLEKALLKSELDLEEDKIPEVVHKGHRANLEPIIKEYKDAVYTLQTFKDSKNDTDKARTS